MISRLRKFGLGVYQIGELFRKLGCGMLAQPCCMASKPHHFAARSQLQRITSACDRETHPVRTVRASPMMALHAGLENKRFGQASILGDQLHS
jgi:hypothetical protein